MFELDLAVLGILVGTVLPIVVGIVTKEVRSGALRSSLLAFLSAVAGAANMAIHDQGVFTKETIVAAAITFVTASASYYGFLKPSGISPTINEKTSEFGI